MYKPVNIRHNDNKGPKKLQLLICAYVSPFNYQHISAVPFAGKISHPGWMGN